MPATVSTLSTVSTVSTRPPNAAAGYGVGGRQLRYLLTSVLFARGPLRVARLVTLLEEEGFDLGPRPSKAVSDALRWEIGWSRVVRISRGVYGPGVMPRSTAWRIRTRTEALRASAARRAAAAGSHE